MNADAPLFRAYWGRVEGRSILTMSRTDWNALEIAMDQPVQLDVQQTPMARVASESSVVLSLGQQYSDATAEIVIVRYDERDQPTPYNQDKYTVWTDVLRHPSVQSMISRASTEANENFRQFTAESVFIVKQDPGADHWLPTLPGSATTVISRI